MWKVKDEHFMEVTLAWSDNQQISGHKIVLSASSTIDDPKYPLFYRILQNFALISYIFYKLCSKKM